MYSTFAEAFEFLAPSAVRDGGNEDGGVGCGGDINGGGGLVPRSWGIAGSA